MRFPVSAIFLFAWLIGRRSFLLHSWMTFPFFRAQVLGFRRTPFFDRLVQNAHASPECYVYAFALIDRLSRAEENRGRNFEIAPSIGHGLYVTALLLAVKLRDDRYYTNSFYAQLAGISNHRMNIMEHRLLLLLDFDLHLSEENFGRYLKAMLGAAKKAAPEARVPVAAVPAPVPTRAPEVVRVAPSTPEAASIKSALAPAPGLKAVKPPPSPPPKKTSTSRYVPPHKRPSVQTPPDQVSRRESGSTDRLAASSSGGSLSNVSSESPSPCSSADGRSGGVPAVYRPGMRHPAAAPL
eukprot:Hpha_TRINITY_DN16649_c0_g6::TRINITY_DN16649_c0_g6_i2::g.182794::m.182794